MKPEELQKLPPEVYKELEEVVGPENISEEPALLDGYAWQPTFNSSPDLWVPRCAAAVLPGSTEEVQAVVRICNKHNILYKAHSTGWGTFNAVKAGGIVLDMRRMNRIVEIDEKNMYAVVEPYVSGISLQAELLSRGLNCHMIGAGCGASLLASATSGVGDGWDGISMSYSPRNVLGVEWVLPDGELLQMGSLGSHGTWFSGDGPGPSLRGAMRGWCGAFGGLGVFTRVAVKIFNWPANGDHRSEGLMFDYLPPLPENLKVFMVVFRDRGSFAEGMYKIGEAEIGYIQCRNALGMILGGALPRFQRKLPGVPAMVEMLKSMQFCLTHIIAANSPRELAYQEKALRAIALDSEAFVLDMGQLPLGGLLFWGLVKDSLPPLIFRIGGQFSSVFGHDETWDSSILLNRVGQEIKQKWIDRDGMIDDLADNAWMFLQEDGMWTHCEELILYDPREEKHVRSVNNAIAEAMISAVEHCQGPGFMLLNPMVRRMLSPMMSHYNFWTKKLKKEFDPLGLSDDVAYCSEEDVEEADIDLENMTFDIPPEELARIFEERISVIPAPREMAQ
ncbi:MAG: FAD-binding oxidoreductase [Actinobacteria bacterium]|nr:FAD-binding oxidoreductase [Actinomycetota bacterium]MBU1944340.1 FAD-binding oxidoreductase [Actinomycetota bacterium]MBU2688325.1 FAD-binding oxidoreductase [Actinomycetota bacterium]